MLVPPLQRRSVSPWDLRRAAPVLMYLGTITAVLGLGKIHARFIAFYDFSGSSRFAWALAYAGLLGVAAYGVGLPDLVRRGHVAINAIAATLVATIGISLVQLLLGSALLPRFVTVLTPVILVPWYIVCGALGTRAGTGGVAMIAVLNNEEAEGLRADIAPRAAVLPCLKAVLSPESARSSETEAQPLLRLARETDASMLVLSQAALQEPSILDQAVALHAAGFRIRTLGVFYDQWLAKLPLHEVGRSSLLFDIGELHRAAYNRLKRTLDAVLGVSGMAALAVVTPAVIAGNLVGNRGRLLYRQPRIGRNGTVFEIYKFRTMSPGPATGTWTADADTRVTPFGRWLRRTHLDELPQAINILRGDLATVGPRPEQPHYVSILAESIPFYEVRHLVRPGLTGWAQVNYPYGASEADAMEKLRYDLYYLRHQSLTVDLRIIVRTLRNVMGGTGR